MSNECCLKKVTHVHPMSWFIYGQILFPEIEFYLQKRQFGNMTIQCLLRKNMEYDFS